MNILIDNNNSNIFPNNPPEERHRHDNSNNTVECVDALYTGSLALGTPYQLHENSEENYECPQCFRTYRRHGTLRRHLRQECGKGKSMVCSVCGHRTKRADHLRQHVRKKHPEMAIRSFFRRPTSAAGSYNHGIRTHGFTHHRLSPQQQQRCGGGMQPLSYTDSRTRPQVSPDASKALTYNAAASAASSAISFMGVDVVDLDAEDDKDIDDDDKSVSDKFDIDNDDNDNDNDNDNNTRTASDTNVGGESTLDIDVAYRQQLHSQQTLYSFRPQLQHHRQPRVDALKSENVD